MRVLYAHCADNARTLLSKSRTLSLIFSRRAASSSRDAANAENTCKFCWYRCETPAGVEDEAEVDASAMFEGVLKV